MGVLRGLVQSRPRATAARHVVQVGTQMSLEGTEGFKAEHEVVSL